MPSCSPSRRAPSSWRACTRATGSRCGGACEETETVINLHVGSSSSFPVTSLDAPVHTSLALLHEASGRALIDWLVSGTLERPPRLTIALSEAQVGWIPFVLDRLDHGFDAHGFDAHAYARGTLTDLPSKCCWGRICGCVVDDRTGIIRRNEVGMDQIMFEVDFPHGDSTWPNSIEAFEELVGEGGLSDVETYELAQGNASARHGLARFGITA